MVNQTLKPMIKPFPILLKSQFAIEILSHNKGQSMISWPLMDLIYLLMQEELNEEQSVTIQTIIENNPMIYNAIQQVHEHRENVKNIDYNRPINIINQQLLLINTLLKTNHMNPIVNYQEIQKIIDLNMSLSQDKRFSNTLSLNEIKNPKGVYVSNDTTTLNTYAKLYSLNEIEISLGEHLTQNHHSETSTKASEPRFFSKLVNRLLGRNQNSVSLESEKNTDPYSINENGTKNNTQNRNNEAMALYTQWTATQLLTAIETSMPIAHYINQNSNRFIYRSYVDHKLDLFYDEVNQHIQSPKWMNTYKKNETLLTDVSNSLLKNRYFIKPNNSLIKNNNFSKIQLSTQENRINAMLQYNVTKNMQNQAINPKLNHDINLNSNQELNYEINQNLNSTQKKNSLFLESIIRHVQNNIQMNNAKIMNSNLKTNTSIDTDAVTHVNNITHVNNTLNLNSTVDMNTFNNTSGYTDSDLSIINTHNFFEKNQNLMATHLLRTHGGLYNININQNQMNYAFEENALYRSLNLINRQLIPKEQLSHNDTFIKNTVINNTIQYSRLYEIQNAQTQNQNNEHRIYQNVLLENQNHFENDHTFENMNLEMMSNINTSHKINNTTGDDARITYIQKAFSTNNKYNTDINNDTRYGELYEINQISFNPNSVYNNSIYTNVNADDYVTYINQNRQYNTNPLMVYYTSHNNLNNDYKGALRHILFTNIETVYSFDNTMNKLNESINKLIYKSADSSVDSSKSNSETDPINNSPIINPIMSPMNRLISIKAFNETYLDNITVKYNALRNLSTFTRDILNRFFSTGDEKVFNQIQAYFEQIEPLNFESQNRWTQESRILNTNALNYKSEIHQINTQPLGLYQSMILNDLIHHTALSADQFLTHRFSNLNLMSNDNHLKTKAPHFELNAREHSDYTTVSMTHVMNDPQSLIHLAASLVNQSNRFLEQHHFYYKNKLQASESLSNLISQTTIRGDESLNKVWIKSILNRNFENDLKPPYNQINLNQTSFENSFKHTFDMLYRGEPTSIQSSELLSKVDQFINQRVLKRTTIDQNAASYTSTNSNLNQNLRMTSNVPFVSQLKSELEAQLASELKTEFESKFESEQKFESEREIEFTQVLNQISSHYLKNIVENKAFLVNLEHKQLQLYNDEISYTTEKGIVHSVQYIKAFFKHYPIRTQARILIKTQKRLLNRNNRNSFNNLNRLQNINNLSELDHVEAPLTLIDLLNDSQEHEVINFNYMNTLASVINASNNLYKEIFQLSSKVESNRVDTNSTDSTDPTDNDKTSFRHSSYLLKNQLTKHSTNLLMNPLIKHLATVNKLSQITIEAQLATINNMKSSSQTHPLSLTNNTRNHNSNMSTTSFTGDTNHTSNLNNLSDINNLNNVSTIYSINHMNNVNNTNNTNNVDYTNNANHTNNLSRLNHTHHMTTVHNEMRVNPKIITLKLNHQAFNQAFNEPKSEPNHTNYFATKWQNTVILKNEAENIKLTFNASYLRQRIAPINQMESSSVDYTHEISLLMAELADTQKSSEKVKGRKQKKVAKKNDEKRKAIEREIEHFKFQSKQQQQQQQQNIQHSQFPELVPSFIYQSLKASQKKLDGESIVQKQLHYKNQFVKSKEENKKILNLSEKTVKTISNYTKTLQKSMKQMSILHDIKIPTVTNNTVQMSTFLLQKQTPVNMTHHTDQVMSYSDIESSQLSHKIVEREIVREVMAAPEMVSVLPKDHQESTQNVETAVAPLPETINIDKIADQVYKRVADRVERERRRRGL